MVSGVCKLTGHKGQFVRAHILPKALTRPREKGLPFLQAGNGSRPVRRWDSWYDNELVIRKGEDILSKLDDFAIYELRRSKLIWSGWDVSDNVLAENDRVLGTGLGFRRVVGIDPTKLRLFFLSLLWRAAASERWEFSEIVINFDDLERIRLMLLSGSPDPSNFYPIVLTQLSTRGEVHNHTPIMSNKKFPGFDGEPDYNCEMVRLYMDGLIAHVHITKSDFDLKYFEDMGNLIVGQGEDLVVTTVTYETSSQLANLRRIVLETSFGKGT